MIGGDLGAGADNSLLITESGSVDFSGDGCNFVSFSGKTLGITDSGSGRVSWGAGVDFSGVTIIVCLVKLASSTGAGVCKGVGDCCSSCRTVGGEKTTFGGLGGCSSEGCNTVGGENLTAACDVS